MYWIKNDISKLPPKNINTIRRILDAIDNANAVPQDFEPFRMWRIHLLKGNLKGFWSLDVSANLRIIFKFNEGNAEDVDFIDTH